jgi:hypothetical protein
LKNTSARRKGSPAFSDDPEMRGTKHKLNDDEEEDSEQEAVLETAKDNELPLPAYMNLLKCITDVNDILKTNCHCVCIFTKDCSKWQNAYNFITKLWNPKDQRPILFTDKEEDKTLFLQSNKLITKKY